MSTAFKIKNIILILQKELSRLQLSQQYWIVEVIVRYGRDVLVLTKVREYVAVFILPIVKRRRKDDFTVELMETNTKVSVNSKLLDVCLIRTLK